MILFVLNILVDGFGGFFACAHCEDNGCGTCDGIASRKNTGKRCLTVFVSHDAALLVDIETLGGGFDEGVGNRSDGDDDGLLLK